MLAGGIATAFMLYAVAFLLTEYTFMSLWLYLFVAVVVLFPDISPLLMTAVGFGGGFSVYGLWCMSRIGRIGSTDS